MSNKPFNEPAFPIQYEGSTRNDACGMTMRDFFAAYFMAGRATIPGRIDADYDAKASYEMADAMLRERAK